MQGNFEKHVQEKLDELKLTPEAPVWEKIALRIQPEEKRRRGFFWLPFLAALFVAGGWWLRQSVTGKADPVARLEQRPTKKPTPLKEQIPAPKKGVRPTPSPPAPKPIFTQKRKAALARTVPDLHEPKSNAKQTDAFEKNALTKDDSRQTGNESRANVEKKNTNAIKEEANEILNLNAKQQQPNEDTVARNKKPESKQEATPVAKDSAKKKLAVAQKKWLGRILFSAGWSSVVSPNSAAYAYAFPGNMTGGVSNGASSYRPSGPTRGFSFSLGYAREKKLTNRLAVSVGLQYAYYSTRQKVGAFKSLDTALFYRNFAFDVSGYYASSSPAFNALSQTLYTNRFHVAELPVNVQYQPLKNTPLQLTGGVSYGRLLHSNALSFHSASGVYYLNRQNNNRQSLNLFAGLQYSVKGGAGWKVTLGPVVQYNATPLQKLSYAKQHLFFAGLKTGVEF